MPPAFTTRCSVREWAKGFHPIAEDARGDLDRMISIARVILARSPDERISVSIVGTSVRQAKPVALSIPGNEGKSTGSASGCGSTGPLQRVNHRCAACTVSPAPVIPMRISPGEQRTLLPERSARGISRSKAFARSCSCSRQRWASTDRRATHGTAWPDRHEPGARRPPRFIRSPARARLPSATPSSRKRTCAATRPVLLGVEISVPRAPSLFVEWNSEYHDDILYRARPVSNLAGCEEEPVDSIPDGRLFRRAFSLE